MTFKAFIDGGARDNPGPAAAGIQIVDQGDNLLFAGGFFLGRLTNNQAEYRSLITALELFDKAGISEICIYTDSQLMARQITGEYAVKSPALKDLHGQAVEKLKGFDRWEIKYIPRKENAAADKLVNKTLNAGRDIVVTDTMGLAGPRLEAGPSVSGKGSATPKTNVEVFAIKGAGKDACPAKIKRGQLFVFEDATPAGLCNHACAAVIDAVLALQETGAANPSEDSNITVRCQKPDCKAVFEVRRAGG